MIAAAVLFGSLVFFSLYLFRQSAPGEAGPLTADKKKRNAVYIICGLAIVVCKGWIFILSTRNEPIF